MKTKLMFFPLMVLLLITANAQERGPVAVSPSSDTGIAKVGTSCPTFSWTSVDGALGYKVVIFETTGPNILAYNEMEIIASPILEKEIQGQALSWTPSSDKRLSGETMYVWYVQAVGSYGTGKWSSGKVFRVELVDRMARIGETLSRSLREYGVSEEVIGEVLRKTAYELEGIHADEIADETDYDESTIPIGIQGSETGSNTYYGNGAGASLTSGLNNSFFGYHAGNKTDSGNQNTIVGAYAGEELTYGTGNTFVGTSAGSENLGNYNTFIGRDAGANHILGDYNTALGAAAGLNNNGAYNIFIGNSAGSSNDADNNIFIGYRSGLNNSTDNNTFIGYYSGYENTTGAQNTFIGHQAGKINEVGLNNTFVGYQAGMNNISSSNTFLGRSTGELNTTGDSNTFLGHSAGYKNTTGQNGTFVGRAAGYNNEVGDYNTIMGYFAGYNIEGSFNTIIGHNAGYTNSKGEANIFLGHNSGYYETGSHKLYITNSNTSSPLIWGDFSSDILTVHGKLGIGTKSPAYAMELETTGENAAFVAQRTDGATNYINATAGFGNFGTVTNHPLRLAVNSVWRMRLDSDNSLTMASGAICTAGGTWQNYSKREAKENIHDLTTEEAMDTLEGLVAVKYNYKVDREEKHVGFIAEDVPELVASKDRNGISAMDIVAVLTKVVQEQQKQDREHKEIISALQDRIAELQKKIDELKSREK